MIDLYYFMTPNGQKPLIFLEEAGLEYQITKIDITKNEQFQPHFLAISPNNRIPAIVDHKPHIGTSPLALFESGVILEYLADKIGTFLPAAGTRDRYTVLQWLYWQVGGLGPMAGQGHHFKRFSAEKIPYAIERYYNETKRLYKVLDTRLATNQWLGNDYSIADMACFPWVARYDFQEIELGEYPYLQAWFERINAREAVQRAWQIAESLKE